MNSHPDEPEPSQAERQHEPSVELLPLPEHVTAGIVLALLVLIFSAGLFAMRYPRPAVGRVSTRLPSAEALALVVTRTPAPVAVGAVVTSRALASRPTANAPPPARTRAITAATSTSGQVRA